MLDWRRCKCSRNHVALRAAMAEAAASILVLLLRMWACLSVLDWPKRRAPNCRADSRGLFACESTPGTEAPGARVTARPKMGACIALGSASTSPPASPSCSALRKCALKRGLMRLRTPSSTVSGSKRSCDSLTDEGMRDRRFPETAAQADYKQPKTKRTK